MQTQREIETGGNTPLIAEGFGRQYNHARPWAIRGATLTFPTGSITALVGPNGAGKSTLLRACLGYERPDEGRLLVFGADPALEPRRSLTAIGYVPQASSLYARLTIDDHFTLARAARPSFDREHAADQLGRARLTADRRISDLSGGERARVALALALGTRAPLLLLDEPLANLDPLARREFLSSVSDEARTSRTTVVLSSHVVADVEQICDRIVVLVGGRVALESPIAAARTRFATKPLGGIEAEGAIGVFTAATGDTLALVEAQPGTGSASLEEIVLGHLAASIDDHSGGSN